MRISHGNNAAFVLTLKMFARKIDRCGRNVHTTDTLGFADRAFDRFGNRFGSGNNTAPQPA